jgi:hypothetical protein
MSSRFFGVRMPATTSSPCALIEVFAHRLSEVAGRAVAREGHARAGIFAHVAEDHRADVDGGAEQAGDLVDLAVFLARSEFQEPNTARMERSSCSIGILREGLLDLLQVDLLVDVAPVP